MEEENKRLKQELTAFETEFIKIEDLLSRAQTAILSKDDEIKKLKRSLAAEKKRKKSKERESGSSSMRELKSVKDELKKSGDQVAALESHVQSLQASNTANSRRVKELEMALYDVKLERNKLADEIVSFKQKGMLPGDLAREEGTEDAPSSSTKQQVGASHGSIDETTLQELKQLLESENDWSSASVVEEEVAQRLVKLNYLAGSLTHSLDQSNAHLTKDSAAVIGSFVELLKSTKGSQRRLLLFCSLLSMYCANAPNEDEILQQFFLAFFEILLAYHLRKQTIEEPGIQDVEEVFLMLLLKFKDREYTKQGFLNFLQIILYSKQVILSTRELEYVFQSATDEQSNPVLSEKQPQGPCNDIRQRLLKRRHSLCEAFLANDQLPFCSKVVLLIVLKRHLFESSEPNLKERKDSSKLAGSGLVPSLRKLLSATEQQQAAEGSRLSLIFICANKVVEAVVEKLSNTPQSEVRQVLQYPVAGTVQHCTSLQLDISQSLLLLARELGVVYVQDKAVQQLIQWYVTSKHLRDRSRTLLPALKGFMKRLVEAALGHVDE